MNKQILYAILGFVTAALAPSVASAETPEWTEQGGFMTFGGNEGTPGLCLDVFADKLQAGAEIDSATCNSTNAQKWTLIGLLGSVMQLSPTAAPGLCLAIANDNPGQGKVTLEACNQDDYGQQWQFSGGRIIAFDYASSNGSPYCLDVLDGQPANSQPMDLAVCNDTPAQEFWPYGIPITFPSMVTGQDDALDVFGDSFSIGGTVDDFTASTSNAAQLFFLTKNHEIMHGSICLDTPTYTGQQGNLAFESCTGSATQQWHFVYANVPSIPNPQAVGTLNIVNAETGPGDVTECLDIKGGNTAPSTPVDSFICNSTGAQLWTAYVDVNP